MIYESKSGIIIVLPESNIFVGLNFKLDIGTLTVSSASRLSAL